MVAVIVQLCAVVKLAGAVQVTLWPVVPDSVPPEVVQLRLGLPVVLAVKLLVSDPAETVVVFGFTVTEVQVGTVAAAPVVKLQLKVGLTMAPVQESPTQTVQ